MGKDVFFNFEMTSDEVLYLSAILSAVINDKPENLNDFKGEAYGILNSLFNQTHNNVK